MKCDWAYCRNVATWRVYVAYCCDKHLPEAIRDHFDREAVLKAERMEVRQIGEKA